MKAVVVGAGGFLGRAVVAALRLRGHHVIAYARPDIDLTDARAVAANDLAGDVLVNCAARTPRPDGVDLARYLEANVIAAYTVTAHAIARGVRRVVHASTLSVVARPWPTPLTEDAPTYPVGAAAPYAVSKLAGEVLVATRCRDAGVPHAILRFSALYGVGMPWHGLVPRFVDLALGGGRPSVDAGGATTVDLLHVEDAADAVVAAVESEVVGVVNVAAGVETSIAEVAETILAAAGRRRDEYDVITSGIAARAAVSIDRLRDVVGFLPRTPLDAGLRALVASAQR